MYINFNQIYFNSIYTNQGIIGIIKKIIEYNNCKNNGSIQQEIIFEKDKYIYKPILDNFLDICNKISRDHYLKRYLKLCLIRFINKINLTLVVNKNDLLFNNFVENKYIQVVNNNKIFNFSINDITQLFSKALENNEELIIDPKLPKNPYTNCVFNYFQIHQMITFLSKNVNNIGTTLMLFRSVNYDIVKFKHLYTDYLNKCACYNFVNNLDFITILIELQMLFKKYVKNKYTITVSNRIHMKNMTKKYIIDIKNILADYLYYDQFLVGDFCLENISKISYYNQNISTKIKTIYSLYNECKIEKQSDNNQLVNGVFVFQAKRDPTRILKRKHNIFYRKKYITNIFSFKDPLSIDSKNLYIYNECQDLINEKKNDIFQKNIYDKLDLYYQIYEEVLNEYEIFNLPKSKLVEIFKEHNMYL